MTIEVTNQSIYVAECTKNHVRTERNLRFEIQAHSSIALFCPFAMITRDVLDNLTISQHVIDTSGECTDAKEDKLHRISRQIYIDRTDEGDYRVLRSRFESKQLAALVPVNVWSNGDDVVAIFDRLDDLDSVHLQVLLDAIGQDVDRFLSTIVIVTRRLDIAEICGKIVYIEDDTLYMETLNQGRKSFVVHLEPDAVVRKFYNDNGDKLTKSLREIGFYLHYAHSEAIPKLLDYRVANHISTAYLEGQAVDEINFADEKWKIELTKRYALAVTDLFRDSKPVNDELKREYYSGLGAQGNFEAVMNGLNALAAHFVGCDRLQKLVSTVEKMRVTDELLIKLDWNSSNVIVSKSGQIRFIDFEQAFIGTSEMLVGILLHNPVWCARTLVRELRNQTSVSLDAKALSITVHFAFAAVMIDSISRSGSPWSIDRFDLAFKRHVTERLEVIGVY